MTPNQFCQQLCLHGVKLNPEQLKQFAEYYRLMIKVNQRINLTTITQKSMVYLKHFYDSLTPAFYFEGLRHHHLSVCDVGSGAGFPALPLKIAFPQLNVTIIDAVNKRIRFLERLCQALRLKNVALNHSRAETFGRFKSPHREQYDLVLARAVAKLNVLAEYCLPLVKVGGSFIAMKSVRAHEELKQAAFAIKLLGGKLVALHSFTLAGSNEKRSLIVIRKQKKTPQKYPRRSGVPSRKPLSR